MSEERDVIRGKLKQIVFRNDDNGYTVARFIVDDLQQRHLVNPRRSSELQVIKNHEIHPRIGRAGLNFRLFHCMIKAQKNSQRR